MWSAAVLRHLPASFGAAAADLSAVPHHVVSIGQTFAVFGAAVANFGRTQHRYGYEARNCAA
jgi:hypothetical protein